MVANLKSFIFLKRTKRVRTDLLSEGSSRLKHEKQPSMQFSFEQFLLRRNTDVFAFYFKENLEHRLFMVLERL